MHDLDGRVSRRGLLSLFALPLLLASAPAWAAAAAESYVSTVGNGVLAAARGYSGHSALLPRDLSQEPDAGSSVQVLRPRRKLHFEGVRESCELARRPEA